MFDDLESVDAATLVDRLVAEQRTVAAAEARSLRIAAALYRRSRGWMSGLATSVGVGELREITAAEIGPALTLTRFSALAMVDLALTAEARLPLSLAALAEGRISLRKLRLVAEHTDVLDDAACAAVEAQVLPRADTQTVPLLGAALAKTVIAADPAAAEARRRSARDDRRVSLHPGHDGMSHLHAVLPEPQARRWYDALTATAHAAAADDDQRGIDQLRADTLLDLLLQPPSDSPVAGPTVATDADTPTGARRRSRWGTRPTTVHVTVPWTTLTGITDDPGDLAGYGPITAAHARELAADATWRRILTDPESGTILDVGTTVYAPPAAIARHVRTRDRTCRFPGCRQPATRCDLDHTVPHPHGPTAETNLNTLCRRHHRTKTFTRSRLQHLPGAVMAWTSPTGHTYRTYPWAPDPPERRTEEPPPF